MAARTGIEIPMPMPTVAPASVETVACVSPGIVGVGNESSSGQDD